MNRSYRNEIALGLLILAAAAILGYLSLKIGGISVKEGVEVTVVLDDASGLVQDADVMVAGVKVGRLKKLGVEHDRAVLTVVLDKEAKLRKDVKATVRAKSLLGEKFLALIPVSTTAPALEDGDVITETTSSLEIDQLVSIMGPILKAIDPHDVQVIVKTLSSSLEGKSESIGNIIANMETFTGDLKSLISDNRPRIEQMVDEMEGLVNEASTALSTNRPAIERTIANVEEATAELKKKTPQLADDISTITANLRTVSENLMADYPKYAGRLDQISLDIMRVTDAFSREFPQMAEKTASTLENISLATDKLPQALDNFNEMAPELKSVLIRADSVLEKADNITSEDIWQILREVGVKVNFF
jgi:phospholipid/cholesterol/gamma-HCH transport system substrate-binding protein